MWNISYTIGPRSRWLGLLAAILALPACGDDGNGPSGPEGFRGPYTLDNWTASGITGGTTSITPAAGAADTARFSYLVDLGNPGNGVSFRTATYSVPAAHSGTVTFDWVYTGYHAFFATRAYLVVYAQTSSGTTEIPLIDDVASGGFSFNGTATIEVEAGLPFGVTIGGSNFDSDSELDGTLKVFNFDAP